MLGVFQIALSTKERLNPFRSLLEPRVTSKHTRLLYPTAVTFPSEMRCCYQANKSPTSPLKMRHIWPPSSASGRLRMRPNENSNRSTGAFYINGQPWLNSPPAVPEAQYNTTRDCTVDRKLFHSHSKRLYGAPLASNNFLRRQLELTPKLPPATRCPSPVRTKKSGFTQGFPRTRAIRCASWAWAWGRVARRA